MNKLFSKIAALSVGLAMAVGVGVAIGHQGVREVRATDASWNASAQGFSDQQQLAGTSYSFSDSNVTISFATAVGNSGHKYYNNGSAVRSYGGESFTIACSAGNMTAITLSNNQSKTVTASVGTISGNNWTGDAASVTFTVASGSGNFRTSTVSVVYSGETPTGPFTVTYNGNGATSGSMTDSKEYESGDTVTIMACAFMRTDYEVTGWNTKADGTGTAYGLSAQFTITNNVTLYAQWHSLLPEPGSEEDPYTVAEAIAAIDASSFPTPAYVSGIICQIDSYDATHKSITYWISDDGSTTTKLQVYSGKGLNGAEFSAKEDIEVKATVTVTGTLKKYNSTYEFNYDNYQVSYVAPVHEDPTLKLDSVKGHLVLGSASLSSTTVTASFESFSGTPTVSVVVEPAKVNVSIAGASITISAKSAGVETVTFRATYNSEVADVEYKVAVTTNEGTAINPFLVSEARNVLDAMETVTGYVLGAISQIDSYDSTYHSITYWISDDGTTTDQLECYSGKGYNGANFSSKDDLTTGTMVVVSGTLKIYKSTYEFDKNNRITEFSRVENLATEILNRTYTVCHDYDDVTDNHDAIAAIWEILAGSGYYGDFTDTEKAFIQSIEAKEDGEFLEQAMARYDYLTGKYKLTNFINGRTPAESGFVSVSSFGSNNNSYIIIIVISAVSVMSFGLALFLRKKRSK